MMKEGFLLLTFIFSTFLCTSATTVNKVVQTPSGTIEGDVIFHNGIPVGTFLGVPYAKPPIGNLRFKKPVPIATENTGMGPNPIGTGSTRIKAKEMPPGCVQYTSNPFPWRDNLPGLSEDCLYLNIWVPMNANVLNKKSVMFWIHGGGFSMGSIILDYYNGEALAAEGDVIVVTANYRLGALGFLYSNTADASGNMGMFDLVEALKWVRDNIEPFGGDKDSITLFGQSAGSITVGMFAVSPITKGLFKRIIMQSGSPTYLDGEDNNLAFNVSQRLAGEVGCAKNENELEEDPETVVKCLRNVDAFKLQKALSKIPVNNPRKVSPRFGDEFLPKKPRQAIIDGDFEAVDVLIGSNNGDGADLITVPNQEIFGFFGEKDPQINLTFGESILRKKFENYHDPDSVVTQYLGGLQENEYDKIRFEIFIAAGDYARVCPSVYFAESFAKKGSLTYHYFFIHRPSNTPWAPWMLAVHFDETPFVFGYPLRYPQYYTPKERLLSRRMIQAWSSFAQTGIPQPGVWPFYSKENPKYQVLDVNDFGTAYGPHGKNCDFFRSAFGF